MILINYLFSVYLKTKILHYQYRTTLNNFYSGNWQNTIIVDILI